MLIVLLVTLAIILQHGKASSFETKLDLLHIGPSNQQQLSIPAMAHPIVGDAIEHPELWKKRAKIVQRNWMNRVDANCALKEIPTRHRVEQKIVMGSIRRYIHNSSKVTIEENGDKQSVLIELSQGALIIILSGGNVKVVSEASKFGWKPHIGGIIVLALFDGEKYDAAQVSNNFHLSTGENLNALLMEIFDGSDYAIQALQVVPKTEIY